MKRFLTIAFAVAVSYGSSARAQAPEDDSGLRANCVGDYFRFCTAYMPGSTAIRQCFTRNFPQLTPACQGAIRTFDRGVNRRSLESR